MQWCVLHLVLSYVFILDSLWSKLCSFVSTLFQVHHGFYTAYHNTTLRPGILSAVERAKELYGDIKIMLTGHSMGGAMAAFCALDLTVIVTSRVLKFVLSEHFVFYMSYEYTID